MSDPFDDWESAFDAGIEPEIPKKTAERLNAAIWNEANRETVPYEIYLENQNQTFYKSEIKLLTRKKDDTTNSRTPTLQNQTPEEKKKIDEEKLRLRELSYQQARKKIFEENSSRNSNPNNMANSKNQDKPESKPKP
ncbi:hypothetical protein BB559_004361 [Furculomyces boomerangus]|uniref:SUZ domain-containing protein n=1 Tax=Furculomyces boomerangus TaxID=61424 RepID=A0A2T9YF42_9FUNG|nr:hypothetical protein BB559_004361 [Furculomyces boomerangus]